MQLRRLNPAKDFIGVSAVVTIDTVDELYQLWRAKRMLPQTKISNCPDREIWLVLVTQITAILEPEIRKYVLEPRGRKDF